MKLELRFFGLIHVIYLPTIHDYPPPLNRMSLRDFVITSVGCSTLTLGIVITVLLHVIFICVYDNEVLFPFSGFQFLVAEYDYKSYCYYGMSFHTFLLLSSSFLARFGIGGVGG